jgi:hypothetical protein
MSDATPTPGNGHASGSHYQPSLGVVLAIVVLFVGATFLMVRSVSPSTAAIGTTTTTTSTTSGTTPPPIVKSRVSVQVANGTNISQLAAHYTQLLTTQNWDTLPADNGRQIDLVTIECRAQHIDGHGAKLFEWSIAMSSNSEIDLGQRVHPEELSEVDEERNLHAVTGLEVQRL